MPSRRQSLSLTTRASVRGPRQQTRRAHTLPMQHKHQNGAREQVRLDDSRRRAVAIADQLGGLSGRDVTADRLAVHPGQRRHLPQRRAVQQHPKDLFHLDHGHRPIGQAATTTTARPTTGEPRRVVPSLADRCSPARGKTTAQPVPFSCQGDTTGPPTASPRASRRWLETGWAAAEMHSEQMNPRCKRRISGYPRRYVAPDPGGAVGRQRWRVTLRGSDGRSSSHRPALVA